MYSTVSEDVQDLGTVTCVGCEVTGAYPPLITIHKGGLNKLNQPIHPCQSNGAVESVLVQCWPSVCDAGPALKHHWVDGSSLQGWYVGLIIYVPATTENIYNYNLFLCRKCSLERIKHKKIYPYIFS